MSALAYRAQSTAEHSQRVADFVLLAADNLIPVSDMFVLESDRIAARYRQAGRA